MKTAITLLHYSVAGGKEHNPPDSYVANPEGTDEAFWIELSALRDGTFA